MIINTGGRTDTVQYYTEWLLNRFAEGYVLSRNPLFPNKINRYELTPDTVDCVVFCSKNYKPILPRLHEITDCFNTYFHYTITAYGKDLEPGVPSIDESMDTLIALSKLVGPQRVAWRYDPVLLTKEYTIQRHQETFERMAKVLAPHIDRCIFSFVELYKKLEVNMPELVPLSMEDMNELAKRLGAIAAKYGIRIQTCGTNGDFTHYGIHSSGCMTLDILGEANGIVFKDRKHKGTRQGCHCIESRDIGAYDTCLNGCKYCYANKTPRKAFENFKLHDPASPLLLGQVRPDDTVIQGVQKPFKRIKNSGILAGNLLSIYSIGSLIGILVAGVLMDKIGIKKTVILSLILQAIGLGCLVAFGMTGNKLLSYGYLFFALAMFLPKLLPAILLSTVFGVKDYGNIYATANLFFLVGAALGSVLTSILQGIVGYAMSWLIYIVIAVLMFLCVAAALKGGKKLQEQYPDGDPEDAVA